MFRVIYKEKSLRTIWDANCSVCMDWVFIEIDGRAESHAGLDSKSAV